jgi:hypothetical protein
MAAFDWTCGNRPIATSSARSQRTPERFLAEKPSEQGRYERPDTDRSFIRRRNQPIPYCSGSASTFQPHASIITSNRRVLGK